MEIKAGPNETVQSYEIFWLIYTAKLKIEYGQDSKSRIK